MKKRISLLLAAVMLLSMVGCGAESGETAPVATEPAVQATAAPTEEPTVAPTEDPNAYTVYELAEDETYEEAAWNHGFWEVDMNVCVLDAEEQGATDAQATPLSLQLRQNGFRMDVDYTGYDYLSGKVVPYGTVELIGEKADGLADISGINPEDYQFTGSSYTEDQNGVITDYFSYANGYGQFDSYWYYNVDDNGELCDMVYVAATYFTSTRNLYNIVYHVANEAADRTEPILLARINSFNPYSRFRSRVKTLTYGEFTYEMAKFAIQCGDTRYVYEYRPGMSLSDWACSELNTDGWIPWYGDTVLSPDRKYIGDWGYPDMREMMDFYGCDSLLIAEEYDGSINRLNNNSTYADISNAEELHLSEQDLANGGGVIMMEADQLQAFMEQHGLSSIEELQEYLQQNGTEGLPGTTVQPDMEDGEANAEDIVNAMAASEENEIMLYGNISVSVAHMVNARTPLFTPGFRVISKKDGRVAYHSVEMGGGHYLLDDVLDIYMNGIADELIPYIKLYAFPESEEFMATLEGHTILNAHTAPLEQGDPMMTLPENAVCLTFERVSDGKEAPNSPNPLIVPNGVMHNGMLHGNLNKDAVYARYVTKDDPNFGEGVNLVFAITFDDELVYWIHMGANFSETVDVEYISPEMRY